VKPLGFRLLASPEAGGEKNERGMRKGDASSKAQRAQTREVQKLKRARILPRFETEPGCTKG
jgi:hypothetical protein